MSRRPRVRGEIVVPGGRVDQPPVGPVRCHGGGGEPGARLPGRRGHKPDRGDGAGAWGFRRAGVPDGAAGPGCRAARAFGGRGCNRRGELRNHDPHRVGAAGGPALPVRGHRGPIPAPTPDGPDDRPAAADGRLDLGEGGRPVPSPLHPGRRFEGDPIRDAGGFRAGEIRPPAGRAVRGRSRDRGGASSDAGSYGTDALRDGSRDLPDRPGGYGASRPHASTRWTFRFPGTSPRPPFSSYWRPFRKGRSSSSGAWG